MKAPKILYFVDGMAPTSEDMQKAADIKGQVCFRNARAVPSEGSLEKCDGVAGKVPATYRNMPTAEQAIRSHVEKLKAIASKVGDSPAPVPPPAPQVSGAATDAQQDAQQGTGAGDAPPDPAKAKAPSVAPAGAAGAAWKSN